MGTRRLGWAAVGTGAVAATALLALGSGGGAAKAAATATIAVNAPCYVSVGSRVQQMEVTGSGFTPGDEVDISDATGTVDGTTTASATGTIDVTVRGPESDLTTPGAKTDTITATDNSAAGAITGSTTTEYTSFLQTFARTRKAPGLRALTFRTTWSFSGFPEGKPIYGHYMYKRKVLATQRFGVARGACGILTVRRRVYPATPHHSTYTVQLDNDPRYSRTADPRLIFKLGDLLF